MLANLLFETAVEHADYFIDLHNGGNEYHVPGFVIYSKTENEIEDESVMMSRASNLPYAVGVDKEFGGSMGTEIVDRGIPSVVVEAGGKSHVSEKYYEKNYHAVENIAKELNIVTGESINKVDLSLHDGQTWLHASEGGFFERTASSNTEVSEDDELAKITDIKGNVVENLTAPFDGVILCMRSYPMTRPGDWAIALTPIEQ